MNPNINPINVSVAESEDDDFKKKGRKVSVNSGQLNSKQSDSAPSDLDVLQDKSGKTSAKATSPTETP